MKKFEKNIDLIIRSLPCSVIRELIPCKNTVGCENTDCKDCHDRLKEYLLTEEEIVLTQFEYDLLKANVCDDMTFDFFIQYTKLKANGYFKGIGDVSMTIGEILKRAVIKNEKL